MPPKRKTAEHQSGLSDEEKRKMMEELVPAVTKNVVETLVDMQVIPSANSNLTRSAEEHSPSDKTGSNTSTDSDFRGCGLGGPTMKSVRVCAWLCAYFCLFGVPLIFQSVGLFTPSWASNATCRSIGLMYSCCTENDTDTCKYTAGGNALVLHTISLALMILAMLFSFCEARSICNFRKNYCETGLAFKFMILHLVAFVSFAIAGLFSVIGCIVVSTKFSTSQLGYSFYLSLIPGCLIILLTVIVCFRECKYGLFVDDSSDNTCFFILLKII